ncbi:MAG TPA: UvrD-helicase domain-containing protein [bacterium]|nr:UvrD-helicase domain-containing protein [bacterium]
MTEIAELILQNLNDAQREAVTAPDGPLLVFAGAGSGKTRVLTRRIAYLLAVRDVRPSEVLAVTFTNKAASVMLERVEQLVGRHAAGMWIHTFHGACVRLLRSHAELVGRKPGFSIYDDADQQTLIKELLPKCDIDSEQLTPRQVAALMDQAKNEAVDPAEMAAHVPPPLREKFLNLMQQYKLRVRRNNAFDFGDLIVETIRLLKEQPHIREQYNRRFKYILVDEFQDTNRAQDILLNLLLGEHRNLMVVGDDDQSIYRWRGARIQNILDFEEKFPEAKVVVLGTNYRSTGNILRAADAVIKQNVGRKAKKLDTPNPPGEKIVRYNADDEYDEARYVARTLVELRTREGLRPGDIAVFYRTNAQSRIIEEKLLEWGLPYKVIGGLRFYDRKEIKDALAYLRLLVNPADNVAFARVINVPARGIGGKTLERIFATANRRGIDPIAACREAGANDSEFTGTMRERLKSFAEMIDDLTAYAREHRPSDIAGRMLQDSGYLEMLQASEKIEDKTRLENIGELLKSMEEFEKDAEEEATLEFFLERVSLLSDPDLYDESANAVSLMTLHAAKGLEFRAVFMVGLEEGLLPHSRSLESQAEFEEERRLCYVGITRAKRYLYITMAAMRRSYGGVPMPTRTSPFWRDLPAELVEDIGPARKVAPTIAADNSKVIRRRGEQTSLLYADPPPPPPKATRQARSVSREPEYDYSDSQDPADLDRPLELLCRVKHPQFGYGTVTNLSGSGKMARVTVRFDRVGSKTLVIAYANLAYAGPPPRR